MPNNLMSDLNPAGLELFSDSETFLRDLSEADEAVVTGGKRSNSNSRRRRRRRPVRRRRAARSRSRS